MNKVLVGFDGSESAHHAVAFAVDLAKRYGASLCVLLVARTPDWGALEYERVDVVEREVKHCEEILAEIKAKLGDLTTVPIQFDLVIGQPAKEIVLYAEKHDIDHLVVGHRGHTMFDRWLIGSVARQVIAYAPCAVTIVRDRSADKSMRAKAERHAETETPLL
ncbi:universal stress protein [Trinickia violacea]|uniref:Universal stress protein n=1 Tax=Trinickia violacea TaxID=2571746 RepID=A0A4P8IQS6_9BURK|nr:universal stress protein [Trinickia violacea]QCP50005.1 universal stress protein [Trinickia violacea]